MTRNACVDYEFRIGEDQITRETLCDWLEAYAKEWAFQLEEGDGGYKHYQGHLKLVKKRRANEVRSKIWTHENWLNYFAPTCNNARDQIEKAGSIGKFYATKRDTRIDGPWTNADEEDFVPDHVKSFVPYPWQNDLIHVHLGTNNRKVNVIVDTLGNTGKSTLLTYLMTLPDSHYYQVPAVNCAKDLMQAICDQLSCAKERNPKGIFIDLPRAMSKPALKEIYEAIEQIKDGYSYETRYKFREWRFNRPAVTVFTNEMPNLKWLTPDRWNILQISKSRELIVDPQP